MATKELILRAPLSGPIIPLDQVPDPVFAQKLVGDGISIDPINDVLVAPCAGEIIQIHRARHAVTLKSPEGIEVLMHVGIDTVGLKGVGFKTHVTEGQHVAAGDKLMTFDADFVATKARSLLTQILITNGDRVSQTQYGGGFAKSGESAILTLHINDIADNSAETSGNQEQITLVILNPQGLHARPSALIANHAKHYQAQIKLHRQGQEANAKSVISIMGLELARGDEILLSATGADAGKAIAELSQMIRDGLGEACEPISSADISRNTVSTDLGGTNIAGNQLQNSSPKPLTTRSSNTASLKPLPPDGKLTGVTASPGYAVGRLWKLNHDVGDIPEASDNPSQEIIALDKALANAQKALVDLAASTHNQEQKSIFEAHQELLGDPTLIEDAHQLIQQQKTAAWAWYAAYEKQSTALAKLQNTLLAARATDMRDVGKRVLHLLLGIDRDGIDIPEGAVLLAEDLTPSDTAQLDPSKVRGFCTATGGASSHVAIIARSLNIPAIAGIDRRALSVANHTPVLLNADEGILQINPSKSDIELLKAEYEAEDILNETAQAVATEPAITQSGEHIEVVGNIGNVNDVKGAREKGAEGIGLLRSEFLFMNRRTAPSEEEQYQAYKEIASTFSSQQKVIIRTLDVGGDKPLAYLPLPNEENPFLGLRGIRVSLVHEKLFREQVRAILRAGAETRNLHIMFPMVTTLHDLRAAKAIVNYERALLGIAPIPIGIMVEVPSVALLASRFAKEVDFFSIGTNDLTQYTLAVDRGHPDLAKTADPLNPAVLALIDHTVKGANEHNIWVGVCGGIASDPLAVPLLVGLGVKELSGSLPSLPRVKSAVRDQNMADCKILAAAALKQGTAEEVRALLMHHKQNQQGRFTKDLV